MENTMKEKDALDVSLVVKRTARKIAEEIMPLIAKRIEEDCPEKNIDFFQREVFSLLSAYILSHSIKILQSYGVDGELIACMCKNTIEVSYQFANLGKFKDKQAKSKEH